MNKLLFEEGGQPLHLDDLAFMQSALSSPFETLLSSWGNCILGGCHITIDPETSHTRVSAGYIAYEGRAYRVSASSLGQTEPSDSFYWLFSEWQDGVKTFENGDEQATRQLYTATLVSTRHEPSSAPFIADTLLPRLGVDIAPRPRLAYKYDGSGELVEFRELSRYSGVLTLLIPAQTSLPKNGSFATLSLSGVNNMSGRWTGVHGDISRSITLTNGKLTASEQRPESAGTTSHTSFPHNVYVSLFVSWDFEENNGAGSGINQGTGSNYTGRAQTTYPNGSQSSYAGSRPRR